MKKINICRQAFGIDGLLSRLPVLVELVFLYLKILKIFWFLLEIFIIRLNTRMKKNIQTKFYNAIFKTHT